MFSVGELNSRINALRAENRELRKELDEYKSLKADLNNLIEAHFTRKKQDRSLISEVRLEPSRCVNSFLYEFDSQLNSGIDNALSGEASFVTANINKRLHLIECTINDNDSTINSFQKA